ncbi:MAG: hypothetical protein ABDH37_05575 [Candidatus Hydrothermales bacterium]
MIEPVFLSADLYAESIYSIRISEGLLFKLNADEKFSNFPPGYLHPFVYALIYLLCLKNKDLFILVTYLFNSIIMFFTILIIKKFYEKFFSEKSNFPIFFLIFSFPFFINFYLTLNFPLYTFLFYLSLYFSDDDKKFFLIYPLLIFLRPEGLIVAIFYFFYRLFTLKNFKGNFIPIISVLLISILPFLLNYLLTGFLTTTALRAQSLFFNYELSLAIIKGFETFLKHFAGILLGFPLLNIQVTNYLSTFIYPPFFLLFIIIYIFKEKNPLHFIFFSIFILVFFISSFSIFSGIHFSRHIAFLYPILTFFLYRGIKLIRFNFFLFLYFLFLVGQFLFFILNIRTILSVTLKIKNTVIKAAELVPRGEEVITYSDPYFFFYNMEKLKVRMLSPSFNLETSKEIRNFIDKENTKRMLLKFIEHKLTGAEFYFVSFKDPLREVIQKIFTDSMFVNDNFILLKRNFFIK